MLVSLENCASASQNARELLFDTKCRLVTIELRVVRLPRLRLSGVVFRGSAARVATTAVRKDILDQSDCLTEIKAKFINIALNITIYITTMC